MYINKNKIAILLATYNGAKYLKVQMDSLFAQTSKDWTLFVHDDGSTDNTMDIIDSYKVKYGEKVVVIDDGIKGLRARNNFFHLLEVVDSEYYMFCDQDDYWHPDMVEIFESKLEEININGVKPLVLHSDYSLADGNLKIQSLSYWDKAHIVPERLYNKNIICLANPIRGANALLNKAMKQLLFPLKQNNFMYDNWLGYVAACNNAAITPIHKPTNIYRIHENNCIGSSLGSKKSIATILKGNIEKYKTLKTGDYGSPLRYIYYKIAYCFLRLTTR